MPELDYTGSNVYQTLKPFIAIAAKQYGIPELLLTRLLAQESVNFDPYYVYGPGKSPAGAAGIGQFMPGTAKEMGIAGQEFDPVVAIDAAARYLVKNMSYFKSQGISSGSWDDIEAAKLALAAYNAGPGAVEAAYNKTRNKTRPVVDLPGPLGIFEMPQKNPAYGQEWTNFLPSETQTYLQKITLPSLADINQAATGQSSANAQTYSDISQVPMPQPKDFPGFEEGTTDWASYHQALLAWQQNQAFKSSSVQDYLRTMIQAQANEIAQGRLGLDEASESFDRQLGSFTAGQNAFAQLLEYSIPSNITQLPLTSPGNPNPQYIQATPIRMNPIQDAMGLIGNSMPIPTRGGAIGNPVLDALMQNAPPGYLSPGANSGGLSGIANPEPGFISKVGNAFEEALAQIRGMGGAVPSVMPSMQLGNTGIDPRFQRAMGSPNIDPGFTRGLPQF